MAVAVRAVREDRVERFRSKLVVRRGWFEHETDDDTREFVRKHFDGSLCSVEIQQLLEEFIDQAENPFDVVVYDSPLSEWVVGPIEGAATSRRLAIARPEDAALVSREIAGAKGSGLAVLLVVPMVDSGTTLQGLMSAMESEPDVTSIRALAILSTRGTREELGERALVDAAGDCAGTVAYMLRVEQQRVCETDPDCDPVQLGVNPDDRRRENGAGLTTCEFWDLVSCAGLKPEDDVPRWREPSGYVPDFDRMLEQYGSWLVMKLAIAVRADVRLLSQDTLYVAPAGESASTELGRLLRLVAGAQVVYIPRPVIDFLVGQPDVRLDEIRERFGNPSPWLLHLQSSLTDQVVVFDEFVATGSTIRALMRLLTAFGFTVVCIATLTDFAPDVVRFAVPLRSLYSWQRPPKEPK